MNDRIVLCSDHINKDFTLRDAINYSLSNNYLLEVHKIHFKELFSLTSFKPIIMTIHPHWKDYSLSTSDEEYFKQSIDYLKNLLDFIGKKHIKYIVIHPEGIPADLKKNERLESVIRAFSKLSNYIDQYRKYKCTILVENITPSVIYPPSKKFADYHIGEKLEDLNPILDLGENIHFLFDLGHFLCSYKIYGEEQLKILKELSNKLSYVHVHDNNGYQNNHEPISRIDSIEILREIEINNHPLFSFEINPSFKGLNKSIEIIKKILR